MSIQYLIGDCLEVLSGMEPDSVQCVCTSPPYYWQREYVPGDHPLKSAEIGLESTPHEFVARLVEVFRAVRRVLRPDGTLWLNIGDTAASGGRGGAGSFTHERRAWKDRNGEGVKGWRSPPDGLHRKDLIGIPWRLAFALQDDGWILRQKIIWEKPNVAPESVTDRPTRSHEQVFLLAKTGSYFYDGEAIMEPSSPNSHARAKRSRSDNHKNADGGPRKQSIFSGMPVAGTMLPVSPSQKKLVADDGSDGRAKSNASYNAAMVELRPFRNKRSVWTIPTVGYSEAHFATFPPQLAETCILAGSRRGDLVLDPFGGSGTVGQVADAHGRRAVLIDIDERNAPMADRRLADNQRFLPVIT